MEAIGPLSCTNDGIYLAGGAPSGNAYLWEVSKHSIKLHYLYCILYIKTKKVLSWYGAAKACSM